MLAALRWSAAGGLGLEVGLPGGPVEVPEVRQVCRPRSHACCSRQKAVK